MPVGSRLSTLAALLLAGACGVGALAAGEPRAAIDTHKLPPTYLPHDQLPDSLALLPPPPGPGSAAMRRDEEARKSARELRGSAREFEGVM